MSKIALKLLQRAGFSIYSGMARSGELGNFPATHDTQRPLLNQNMHDLDKAYSPSQWSHRTCFSPDEIVEDFVKGCDEGSKKFLAGNGFHRRLNVSYGKDEREKVDMFVPESADNDAPVMMFLHGGYWQYEQLSKENNSLIAGPLVEHGAVVVIVGYSLAPECSVSEMVKQVEQAVLLVAKCFPESRGLYISGHSAGGHLAAMMLSVDWSKHLGKINIKGICPISGLYDLRPIARTYINEPLSLTESSASLVSPILLVDSIPEANVSIKVRLPAGEFNPPVFHPNTREYCQRLVDRGMDAEAMVIPGRDHFDEITRVNEENSTLQQILLKLMDLTS